MKTGKEERPAAALASNSNRDDRNKSSTASGSGKADPFSAEYWTAERRRWMEDLMAENNERYESYLASDERVSSYMGSTSNFVMQLKACPEWAGLTASEAARAIRIGYGKICLDGGDPWTMLPDNELKGLSAEEDFTQAWVQINARLDSGSLGRAVEQSRLSPITWTEEWDEKMSPLSPNFKIFRDTVVYLQTMAGNGGRILLPQHQLAKLIGGGLKQGGVSVYCRKAERAGLLVEVDGRYSQERRRAIIWRSTLSLKKREDQE